MRVGHPCSLERQSFVVYEPTASRDSTKQRAPRSCRADFESISPVLLHAPKISKPPGATSAKSVLFVVFLSAHGQESVVRDRSEVAYNPHPRRRSSVVEQPPCKRQVVCSIQTGGTSFTSSYRIRVIGGPPPAVGGLLAVVRGAGQALRVCRLSSICPAGALRGNGGMRHPLTGERADARPAIRYANPHPATLIYWECVPGRLAAHEIGQRAPGAGRPPDPNVSMHLHGSFRFRQWPPSPLLIYSACPDLRRRIAATVLSLCG